MHDSMYVLKVSPNKQNTVVHKAGAKWIVVHKEAVKFRSKSGPNVITETTFEESRCVENIVDVRTNVFYIYKT